MSQWDKLLEEVRMLSRDMRFEQVRKILEGLGYVGHSPKSGSSHWTFRKPECHPITVPQKSPVLVTYIRLIRDAVEQEEMKTDAPKS